MSRPLKTTVELEATESFGAKGWTVDTGILHASAPSLKELKAEAAERIRSLIQLDPTPRTAIAPGGEVFVLWQTGDGWAYGRASNTYSNGRVQALYLFNANGESEAYQIMAAHAATYEP